MLIRQLSLRLEISFWQLVISLMYESPWVQGLLRWGYHRLLPLISGLPHLIEPKRVAIWGISGFWIGLIFGILVSIW